MFAFVAVLFFILCVAIFSNTQRKNRKFYYELTPNCLLTRWPILFVSGRRSLFYFSKYWNVFPEFLTEHGYDVYSLNLPWDGPSRLEKMREILKTHAEQSRRYHLVMDPMTKTEFADLWSLHLSCVVSITEVKESMSARSPLGIWNSVSYALHRLKLGLAKAPSPHSLGISAKASLKNAELLLQRVSQLAEEDIQAD